MFNEFVFDDRLLIEKNGVVQGQGTWADLVLAPYHAGVDLSGTRLYRPLTLSSFAVDYRLHGPSPTGYHLVNILLHAAVSMLVMWFASRIGLPPIAAPVAALLFAVHPVHTEAVANLAGRAELLAALFFMAAFLAYLRATESGTRHASRFAVVAAVFYLLAMLSKESGVTLLGVVVAWEVVVRPGAHASWRRRLLDRSGVLLALAAAVAAYLVLRSVALDAPFGSPEVSSIDNPLVDASLTERWATAAMIAVRYLGLLVFPLKLSADYSFAQILPISPWSPPAVGSMALLGAMAALWVGSLRRARVVAFLGLFGVITFALSANIIVVIGTIMAERLLYLPSVAACALLGVGFASAAGRLGRPAMWCVLAAVLALGSARTVHRNRDWRDGLALFTAAAETSPASVKVHGNLGAELARRGRYAEARTAIERALARSPEYHGARITLAQSLLGLGEIAAAEREVRRVLQALPDDAVARFQLGEILVRRGRFAGAEEAFRIVLSLEPDSTEARGRLAMVLLARGLPDQAERELLEAVSAAPDSALLLSDLGVLYQRTDRPDEAVAVLERAVALAPSEVAVRNNLGNALREAGRLDESVKTLRAAIEMRPEFVSSHYNLGLTHERAGRTAEARREYTRSAELDPDHGDARRGLGRLALASGNPQSAIPHLDAAIRADTADVEAHALRARSSFRLGRHAEAESDFLRVLTLNPGSVEARNNLGILRALSGDPEGARRWWLEALEIVPENPTILDNLARLDE
jgi:tetratricopeptide (TPR) repeat protein